MNYNFKHPIEAFRNQIMGHNVQALQRNWSTFSFENKSKYKNKIKDKLTCGSLWVSQIFWSSSWHHSILSESTLVHINGDVTWGTFFFICYERGWTNAGNGRGLWLVSFGQLQGADWQHNCHQDVWQTLDKPHELMRGQVHFVGVISVHPGQMWMK